MKKLVLSLAIASTLGLTACDSETIEDVKQEVEENGTAVTATARVVFDPSNGVLSVPNDLLFSGSVDGTLNIPVDDPTNSEDPFVALNALDGWSISNPFVLDIDFPAGTELDGNSVFNPSSVRIFEAVMGGDLTDPDCTSVERGLACKIVGELTYTQDFITQKSGNSIAVVPLKPLKAKTSYLLAMTNNLQDNNGKAIAGSTTYELVRQDINEKPLGNEAQLGLQAVVNSYEKAIVSAGVESDSIIYSAALTTQSTTDVLSTVKSVMAANLQQGVVPTIGVMDTGASVADILGDAIPDSLKPLYSTGNFMQGSITLPYYLGIPTAENPLAPANDWWKSLCDSAAMLAGLAASNPGAIPEEAVSVDDATCMAISEASGLPWPGLRDLSGVIELDTERHLTKYSPVPEAKAMMPIDVQVTTPDISPVTDAVRASFGLPPLTAMPEAGWPVVMLVHGITSRKEEMLPITGILSAFGFATIAIDHPLHGSRGFDLDGDGTDEINTTTVSTLHYVNLKNMLTMRDNTRQSTADILGLRLGMNFLGGVDVNGNPIKVDSSQVHMLGHSLGGIYGMNFLALTNTPLNPAIDPMFKVTSASLAMPGLMLANFGMESPAFEDLAKSNLTYALVPEFKALVDTMYPPSDGGATQEELEAVYNQFYASLPPEKQGELDGMFAQFTFAAQTMTDSGDPIAYVEALAATETPLHLIEVVGNGTDNKPDQTVINTTPNTPMGGTEPAIAFLGLPGVSETTPGSGAVRFVNGHHSSILSPLPNSASPDPELSARATQEMQSQVVGFFASMGQLITITDEDVVLATE